MKEQKKLIMRGILAFEVVAFTFFYLLGSHGLQALMTLTTKNQLLQKDIELLSAEVAGLENDLNQWNSYPYFKEKIARQELQLAYADEELYLRD